MVHTIRLIAEFCPIECTVA